MSADAAAPVVPDVEVPVKTEETATADLEVSVDDVAAESAAPAQTSAKANKVLVAALPKEQPAGIPDAVVEAGILDEAPPARDGKTEDEIRELAANAAQLVAFYFSDSNLPNDRYLFSLTACNEPIYGWVPISVLASFSRMRGMGMSPVDAPFIAWALRRRIAEEGDNSLLAISEDNHNVRRKRVLEKDGADLWARSAYVKGFGERGQEDDKTQEAIEKYMRQFGLINSVRLRREDAGKAGKGKGKGKFKGSIFVEFASLQDLKSFLARETIPKYNPEGAEMEYKSKEDYCVAKAKEKNIPDYSVAANRSNDPSRGSASGFNKNGPSHLLPFNAFREAANLKEGRKANLATIQETTPIVGKRIAVTVAQMTNGAGRDKRKRDDDAEGDKKRVLNTEPLEMQYKDVTLKINRETGQVLDKTQVPFTEDSMVLFTGEGEKSDWRVLKEDIMKIIEKPFLAAPPGSGGGKLAKSDSTTITDEDLQKLKDAKITHGGVEIVWSRPSTEQMQDFWATRASFQGAAIAKANREKEHEKQEQSESHRRQGDRRDGGGRDRDGGRGGGRGRGGRGGGGRGGNRGGHRGGNRGGRGGHRDGANGGSAPTGLPPTLSSA